MAWNEIMSIVGGSGGGLGEYWSRYIFSSQQFTFNTDGAVKLAIVGAGGGGANGQGGVGGNSAPWGRKYIKIKAGDILLITLGAGGAMQQGLRLEGLPGGVTTVSLNGVVIMTAEGAEGGNSYVASRPITQPKPAVAKVIGADYWVPGLVSGTSTNGAFIGSGGASVDLFGLGLGSSPAASASNSPGGSVGTNKGGASPLAGVLSSEFMATIATAILTGSAQQGPGIGAYTAAQSGGWFAGGMGTNNSSEALLGGLGGGGGGTYTHNTGHASVIAKGGDALAFISFKAAS